MVKNIIMCVCVCVCAQSSDGNTNVIPPSELNVNTNTMKLMNEEIKNGCYEELINLFLKKV